MKIHFCHAIIFAALTVAIAAPAFAAHRGAPAGITYNADGQPNLSALRGMTYDQIAKLLGPWENTVPATFTGMNGQPTTYSFVLPPAPPPPSSGENLHSIKGFLGAVVKGMTAPHQQSDIIDWLCFVDFNGHGNTVSNGSCMVDRKFNP